MDVINVPRPLRGRSTSILSRRGDAVLGRRREPISDMIHVVARPSVRWVRVTLDCADAHELASFYSHLLGWEINASDGGWAQVRDPAGGVGLNFQTERWYQPPTWPEAPGAQMKMMHFEVLVDDVEAAVRLVQEAGGTEAPDQPEDRDRGRLRVMLDPAGHPFCLFVHGE